MTDVKTRLAVALNDDGTVKSSVVAAGGGAAVDYSSGVFTISWSPDGPSYTQNLGIEVTANAPVANALRIRLVQRSGATPTSASPVRLGFKVATASAAPSNAAYSVREITSDTALVLSSGSSLGTLVGETARVYVGAIDNNGTIEALAYNPKALVASTTAARVTELYRPSEVATYTTTAEGGAGGADSAATLYSVSARTGIYLRRLGYFDVTLGSTVGNWSNNPNGLTVIGPGTPVTGDVIQSIATYSYGLTKTDTTTCPDDGTIPQISEGSNFLWATMTSTNTINPVLIACESQWANSGGGNRTIIHLHRNSEADAFLAGATSETTASLPQTVNMTVLLATTTTGGTGYYMLAGTQGAGTMTFNGSASANRYGASAFSNFTIKEISA